MKQTIPYITIGIIGMFFGFLIAHPTKIEAAQYHTLPYKIQLIQSYRDYYNQVELLLDNVYTEDSSFLDTYGETDEYYNYAIAKQKVDSLSSLEDCPL